MRRTVLALVVLLAIMANLLAISRSSAAQPNETARDSAFGINSHIASRHPVYETLQTGTDAVAGLGVGWVREDFQFARIEPANGTFDWNWHDRVVDQLSAHNIQVIGLLNRPTPGWANGQRAENVPPDPQTFAAFAGAVVRRYKDRVHYWQVWNEPDNAAYWGPKPDPTAYAALLKATYTAIKAADPSAQVLIAGMVAPEPALSFLRQVQASGAWGAFDIIALHPYTDPLGPEQGQIGVIGIGAVRGLAEAFGAKPIWVSEFGWSTGPADRAASGVDQATQGNYLVRGMALLRAAGAERVLWYNLKDSGASRNLYGLIGYDTSRASYADRLRKTGYTLFQVLNQQLAGTSGATLLDLNELQHAIDFEQPLTWRVGNQRNGTLGQSSAQAHSGSSAGELSYSFPSKANDYVVFNAGARIPLPDGSSALGIWVYGDGSAHELKVWLRDNQGEVLQFRLGTVGGAGWHYISTSIQGQVASYNVISGG
ncbi:MAG: hypothetical protein HGA65_20050, partial [Oscillochloris sp.]|nr:hypothetical protein [Oscillochloris sp.]